MPAVADPDDYVIHQQDVQAVVNALWAGGAEAMMLQDQRVISTSAVRCVGNTLPPGPEVYSPPYVITAIGDPAAMQQALATDPDVENLRQWSVAVGLGYDVSTRAGEQDLPAYSGSIVPEHAAVPSREAPARRLGRRGGHHPRRAAPALRRLAAVVDRRRLRPRGRPGSSPTLEQEFAREATPGGGTGIRHPRGHREDGAFAIVRIPRFGADYARPLIEGTDRPVLALGLGHYVGTAGPGTGRQLLRSPGTARPTAGRSTTSTGCATATASSSRPPARCTSTR